jgi:hypothetical protein
MQTSVIFWNDFRIREPPVLLRKEDPRITSPGFSNKLKEPVLSMEEPAMN